jgi:flagellar biosynthesis protein FlhG
LRIITVASGKGGVGKTTLVGNLGVALAQNDNRVVLFDGDLGLANLDVVLGVKSETTLQHAIEGVASLKDIMVSGPAGVKVVTGSSGIGKMLRLSRKRLEAFLAQISEIESDTDYLIFDAAAGADAKVMTFLKMADEALLITTPDPSSIVDAYATAKILFRNKPDAVVRIIVNMVESKEQASKVFNALQSAISKFIDKPVYFGGYVRLDLRAAECARMRKPFVQADPSSPASKDMKSLAISLKLSAFPKSSLQSKSSSSRAKDGEIAC